MANKLFKKPRDIKECKYSSISKHNAANSSGYLLFDPPNLTSFECFKGQRDGNDVYIREKLACMWGNEDIEEYVILEDKLRSEIDNLFVSNCSREIIKARVGDVILDYTHASGRFSREHYNVKFTYNNVLYYLYIKTSDGRKFKSLMEEFLQNKLT